MSRCRGQSGFTLIEVVVAMLVLSVAILGLGASASRLTTIATATEVRTLAIEAASRKASGGRSPYAGRNYAAPSSAINSAAASPIIIDAAFVFPAMTSGMMDASATRTLSIPTRLNRGSTTVSA